MRRGLWVLLIFSLALNVGFATAVVVHWADMHRAAATSQAEVRPGAPLAEVRPGATRSDSGRVDRRTGPRSWRERCGWMRRGDHGPKPPPPGFLRDWPDGRIARLQTVLHLTPEQTERLHSSLGELREAIRTNATELMRERETLRWALRGGKADPREIRRRARHVGELQARVDSLVAEAFLRENAVLRPEQRDRYRNFEWGPGDAGPLAPPSPDARP